MFVVLRQRCWKIPLQIYTVKNIGIFSLCSKCNIIWSYGKAQLVTCNKIILRNIEMCFFATVPFRSSRNVQNVRCFELTLVMVEN